MMYLVLQKGQNVSYSTADLRERLAFAHETANDLATKVQEKQRFEKHLTIHSRSISTDKYKLADKWERMLTEKWINPKWINNIN